MSIDIEPKKIYTVTTLRRVDGFIKPRVYSLGQRCVGWFSTLERAKKAVEENYGDIYEEGYYPYCVIEEVHEGLYNITGCGEWWYKWGSKKVKPSTFKCQYWPIDKPIELKQILGFGIG